jgi:hypothetical protein
MHMSALRPVLMSLVLAVSFVACKTPRGSQDQSRMASESQSESSQKMRNLFSGVYKFTGPETAVSRQHPLGSNVPGTGTVSFAEGGWMTLEVNFYRSARGGSYLEPGTIAAIKPDGRTRTETYTVSSSGFFGGAATEERKTETTDTQKFDPNTQSLILTSQTTMSSRPYTWFNKKPWAQYKTTTVTITMTGKAVTMHGISVDKIASDETTLTFQRD